MDVAKGENTPDIDTECLWNAINRCQHTTWSVFLLVRDNSVLTCLGDSAMLSRLHLAVESVRDIFSRRLTKIDLLTLKDRTPLLQALVPDNICQS